MEMKKKIAAVVIGFFAMKISLAQDPSFSQFFSSPLNVNPALTANINTKWRLISNYRSQWIGPGEPYSTGTLSADSKIFMEDVGNYVDETFRIGLGGMMMYDQLLGGALKSNYASFNVSGNVLLGSAGARDVNTGWKIRHRSHINSEGAVAHRLGAGMGIIYGNKQFDVNKVNFEEQFTGAGFNINLPTGETALSQMKPYVSVSAGVLYSLVSENANMDLGIAAFHINKPKQTFLNDGRQYLPTRYVAHANLETYLSEQVILSANGIYQKQAGASYFSVGSALGYAFQQNDRDVIVNGGIWYWSNNAIVPYAGFSYDNFQFGLTYDITISKLGEAAIRPHTFELSMILRGGSKRIGFIPTPWK